MDDHRDEKTVGKLNGKIAIVTGAASGPRGEGRVRSGHGGVWSGNSSGCGRWSTSIQTSCP